MSDERGGEEVSGLFRLHYVPMCRLAYVILGDEGAAEEIVMDALLKTFSGWRNVRDPNRADAYLKRAVVNLCRSRIRRQAVERRASSALRRTSAGVHWDANAQGSDDVWQAVLQLPERQRACVVLRYYVDMSEAEIADVLDCSTGTVKSQLFKARSKLEQQLEDPSDGGDR
jgi:RNA polymerase sigma-70 factor (sigma-E family)